MRCGDWIFCNKKELGALKIASKKSIFRLTCALFLLFSLLFSLSCASSVPSYFAYADAFFSAEVRGELYGRAFCARIERRPCKESPNGAEVSVCYLAPTDLAGIGVVAAQAGEEVSSQTALATLGELSLSVGRESVEGWLCPIDRLLALRQTPIAEIARQDSGFTLRLSDGSILKIDDNGTPLSLDAGDLKYEVVWLEWLE